jgi:hypothetical protein
MADGRDDGKSAPSAPAAALVRISPALDKVMTIVYQNKTAALFEGRLDLSKLNFKSNIGVVLGALLEAAGFAWASTGKALWWRAHDARRGAYR